MLRALQQLLETIYDARSGHDVRDFLITRRQQLPRERRALAADEELVLVQRRRSHRLALYVDAAVLARLRRHDPLRALDGDNIGDFWTALEGVSHFCYLMWNAGHQRGISQLDLELQAEVDKYVTSYWLLKAQHPAHVPRELHRALFERTRVSPRLAADEQQLYGTASRHAARFCAVLQGSLLSSRPVARQSAVATLRRFYRLGSQAKLRQIRHLPA